MSSALLQDRDLRALPWRDLVALHPIECLREVLLPLPFLLTALVAVRLRVGWLAVLAFGYFFLGGLRLVHDVFHANLGLRRWANHALLLALSGLMLGSMHAVRLTHLRHHRDCLGPTDVEGATARLTAVRALLGGLAFPIALHAAAWRRAAPTDRRWIGAELGLTTLLVGLAAHGAFPLLTAHVAAMVVAQILVGFFAVWTVHHDVDVDRQLARTMRHRLKSAAALGMFFHLEHHLYPRVPTCHLATLADRLEQAAPRLGSAQVY